MMILKAFVFCLVINYSASVDIDPARSVVEKESGGSYSSRTFRNALNQQVITLAILIIKKNKYFIASRYC